LKIISVRLYTTFGTTVMVTSEKELPIIVNLLENSDNVKAYNVACGGEVLAPTSFGYMNCFKWQLIMGGII